MRLSREQVLEVVRPTIENVRGRRFTQDTPVLPDVWIRYGELEIGERIEVLLEANPEADLQTLVTELQSRLDLIGAPPDAYVIYNESHVCACLNYAELVTAALPLSQWWEREVGGRVSPGQVANLLGEPDLPAMLLEPGRRDRRSAISADILDLIRIVGAIGTGIPLTPASPRVHFEDVVRYVAGQIATWPALPEEANYPLRRIFTNRPAREAITQSRSTIKADAAKRLFEISCKGIRWAVIDSGIDAAHPAFIANPALPLSPANSRIFRTYDFRRLKPFLISAVKPGEDATDATGPATLSSEQRTRIRRDLRERLRQGLPVDWQLLEPILRVPHELPGYTIPLNEHGTHVAGILAANWPGAPIGPRGRTEEMIGMCPDIELIDLRVFSADGAGDEYTILAALQFLRFLNQGKDRALVHGVNLSFSLVHDAATFACGATPVCEECSRLTSAGLVVVAAAGNAGFAGLGKASSNDIRDISITDPGNTEDVITVGATHRSMPHKYGVSFFSSRGPTADGRVKPDLVAPGEKVTSTIPDGRAVMLDGTSMAAPHVSGAAALLIARHRELAGQPARIKRILCSTATDLGRERYFQGAGLVDVLRAIQSI